MSDGGCRATVREPDAGVERGGAFLVPAMMQFTSAVA